MFDQDGMTHKSQLNWVEDLRKVSDAHAKKAQLNHWNGYIPDALLDEMVEIGIVSVRLPVGYWCFEAPVGSESPYDVGFQQEGFITGALWYIEEMVNKLWTRNIDVLIDLHALPGGSTVGNSYAGCIMF